MTVFKHVTRINVSLWGERVGTIVEAPQRGVYAFRFEKKYLKSGIQISPLMMPLRSEPYAFPNLPRAAYEGLPPIFADSLPDMFGTGLIDHWLKEHDYVSVNGEMWNSLFSFLHENTESHESLPSRDREGALEGMLREISVDFRPIYLITTKCQGRTAFGSPIFGCVREL